jgi:acetylcholinesterase
MFMLLGKDPAALMDRDIVLVTINYRLGSFGFLALGTKEAPGNAGMKDQVLALQWVQKNIAKFGGLKNKVTINGYSAGSFSVTALMASPMARNLFHGAIAMSGSITTAVALKREYKDLAERLGQVVKCPKDELLECLRKVIDWNDLLSKQLCVHSSVLGTC